MFAQNKNNKKKRRVHYQLSYQVNIPREVRNQKYKNIKQFVQPQTWSLLSCNVIMYQITLSGHMHWIGVGGGGMTQPPRLLILTCIFCYCQIVMEVEQRPCLMSSEHEQHT